MVVKPEILTLSKFVCPSISTSAFISIFPLKVDIPDISKVELISTGAVNVPIPKTFK